MGAENLAILASTPVLDYRSGEVQADTTARLQAFLNAAGKFGGGRILRGEYKSAALTLDADATIELDEGAVLDFSAGTMTTSAITLGNDTNTPLAGALLGIPGVVNLAADIVQGDRTVTFASDMTGILKPGDWYFAQLPADNSWHYGDAYYRAGEWFRCRSVAGAVVTNDRRALHSYAAAACILAKPTLRRIDLVGGHLIGNISNRTSIIRAKNLERSRIDIKATNAVRAAVDMFRTAESTVRLKMSDYSAPDGLNYGVTAIASLNLDIVDSDIRTSRHAVTFTGGEIAYTMPNRFCYVRDSYLEGDFFAYDNHAPAEYTGAIDCDINGGAQLGGDYSMLRNCNVWNNSHATDQPGVAIRHRDRVGMNTTLVGVTVYANDAIANTDAAIVLDGPSVAAAGSGLIELGVTLRGGAQFRDAVRVVCNGGVASGQRLDVKGSIEWVGSPGLTPPQLRLEAGTTSDGFNDVDVRVSNVGIRWTGGGYKAKNSRISGYVNNAQLDALNINVLDLGQPQVIDIADFACRSAQNGGIVITGPGKTVDVTVNINGGLSRNNNQAGTSSTNSKSSVSLSAIKTAFISGLLMGDTQAVKTQIYGVALANCGTVERRAAPCAGALNDTVAGTDSYTVGERGTGCETVTTTGTLTVTVGAYRPMLFYKDPLPADRAINLSATGGANGDKFDIIRTAASTGAFNLNITSASVTLKALPVGSRASFAFDGTAWSLTGYSLL